MKLKIKENRGDSRRNFVKFEDNLEKKSRRIEEIFQSQFSKDKKDKIKDTVDYTFIKYEEKYEKTNK